MTNAATASEAREARHYFPRVESHLLTSKYVAQTFKVQVMQPMRERDAEQPVPVIYATDGNLAFDVLKGIAYSIQRSPSDAPPFMVVGIGYPEDCPLAGSVLRARDFTFPGYPQLAMKPPTIEGVLQAAAGTKTYLGGEDFQQFIEQELIPFVDDRYATARDERIYFGHSAGAGFGLYTLFKRPELFKHYIISSPSLTYHGTSTAAVKYDNYDFLIREARRFVESGKALRGTRLYMSVGSEEEFEPTYMAWQLTSSFHRLAALLRANAVAGLELITEVFPQETHMTVWPGAYIHGIQAVFGTGRWRRAAP